MKRDKHHYAFGTFWFLPLTTCLQPVAESHPFPSLWFFVVVVLFPIKRMLTSVLQFSRNARLWAPSQRDRLFCSVQVRKLLLVAMSSLQSQLWNGRQCLEEQRWLAFKAVSSSSLGGEETSLLRETRSPGPLHCLSLISAISSGLVSEDVRNHLHPSSLLALHWSPRTFILYFSRQPFILHRPEYPLLHPKPPRRHMQTKHNGKVTYEKFVQASENQITALSPRCVMEKITSS